MSDQTPAEQTCEFVRLEVADGIGTIRLDRPKMNALSTQLQDEIGIVAQQAAEHPEVHAVIVYGGERVFAAGADIKEMQKMSYADMLDRSAKLQSCLTHVAQIPKPTVAAITGYALGGGCELALACDFRVVAEDAKLGQPEILLGVIPGAGGTQRLTRLVGPAVAKDLCLTGRTLSAAEALELRAVEEVVEDGRATERALEWARQFVGGPRIALRAVKEAVDRGIEVDLDTGLAIERALFAALFATEDRELGMQSFIDNGPGKAQFTGR